MHYRLLLELELMILDLAAPPLAIDSLHDRVDYFIKISLVHRSLTAWAQDRLRDQFLYTYRPRPDEYERLKLRFEAGFGRDRPLHRLYLDFTRLPERVHGRTLPGHDSLLAPTEARAYGSVAPVSRASSPERYGSNAPEQACEAVVHYVYADHDTDVEDVDRWELCTMITTYAQALDTLWLKPPYLNLKIKNLPPPRVLDVDDGGFDSPSFRLLPVSSKTVLFLRNVLLDWEGNIGYLNARHLVCDKCSWVPMLESSLRDRFHQLETLVLFRTEVPDLVWFLGNFPTTIRRVHLLQQRIRIGEDRRNSSIVLPHLESFTFTWFLPWTESDLQTSAENDQEALAKLQQIVESMIDAPQCTFKYLCSTESPESALADALATFNL